MTQRNDDLLFPVGTWAALGVDPGSELVKVHALVFEGAVQIDERLDSAQSIHIYLDSLAGMGLELAAAPGAEFVRRIFSDDLEVAQFVPLDDWSMIAGIVPRSIPFTAANVANRLGAIVARLAALDPGVLMRSDAILGWRHNGEQRLIRAALAHSQAIHGAANAKPPELAFLTNRERPERLKRVKNGERVSLAAISDAFDAGGPISRRFDAWEPRPQQRAMAIEIAGHLRDGGELIAEAGTGTGKSLAYFVPALANAVRTGEQVVVATNTRVLQDQLANKDAPLAVDALREVDPDCWPRVQVLKGRANYLCLRRWFADVHDRQLSRSDEESSFAARVNVWLALTESGELSELPLDRAGAALFKRISADGDACDAARCQFQQRNQCFLYRARRSAEAAHVVITNHALLLTDVVQDGEALPDARHLIIDEAHHLEDQATTSFQVTSSPRLINQILNLIAGDPRRGTPGLLTEIDALIGNRQWVTPGADQLEKVRKIVGATVVSVDSIKSEASAFFTELTGIVENSGERSRDYSTRIRVTDAVRHGSGWASVEGRWDSLNIAITRTVSHLSELLSQFPDLASATARQDANIAALMTRVEDLENRLGLSSRELTGFGLNLNDAVHNPKQDQVYWLEMSAGDRRETVIHSAPLQLGDYLRRHLYSRLDSLVLTSATMTTGGNSNFIRQRLGLEDADEVTLSSPFDFEQSAMILIPGDVPEPNQPGFDVAAHRAIFSTAIAARGRTLVLFTSIQAMNQARMALADQLQGAGLLLVTQHEDGSAEQLAERLRSFDRTVVFGAGAFWEGVDVPGPALSALVIARLPFPVPTDPVYAARSETFDNAWTDYTMPQTILKLRQGFGRLIRTQTDRGVCVILDRRLISKRYGATIINALPAAPREYGTISQIESTVRGFLEEGGTR